jgi:hypothetical protein
VWVTDADGTLLGKTVADGDGVFQLRRLPAGPLQLHARAAGKCEGRLTLNAAGQARAATLVLEDGDPLHGTVTRRDGSPVAGATVLVHAANPLPAPLDWQAEAVADEKGVFSLPLAPLRDLVVRAWAPGFKLTDVFVLRDAGGAAAVVLDGPVEPRRVRVTGMVAGQRVSVSCKVGRAGSYPYLPAVLRETTVQADGTAQLWPLPMHHEVAVNAPGFRCFPVFIPCKQDVGGDLEFALTPLPPEVVAPSTRISGKLVDELGRPLQGIPVLSRVDGVCATPVATDAEGGFVLDVSVREKVLFQLGLVPGTWRLGDPRAGLDGDGVTWLSLAADASTPVKLHATRAGAIRGAPMSPAGVPIAAAQVQVKPLDEKGNPNPVARSQLVSASDASGRIDVPGLPAGSYQVIVSDGLGLEGTARVEVPAGGEATIEALTFAPAGEVSGVVRGGDGTPVGGVQLMLGIDQPGPAGRRLPARIQARLAGMTVLTDRSGRFRVGGLAPGDWKMCEVGSPVSRPGVVPAMVSFTVEAGQKVAADLDVGK